MCLSLGILSRNVVYRMVPQLSWALALIESEENLEIIARIYDRDGVHIILRMNSEVGLTTICPWF